MTTLIPPFTPEKFIEESNRIEGIYRRPYPKEIAEYHRFMALEKVTVSDLETFVQTYAGPKHRLRDQEGLNVRVGNYYPPGGGPQVAGLLGELLDLADRSKAMAYDIHTMYESIHPFTDGNGRSGRMLWMWMMQEAPLGFLHHFYYQALSESSSRVSS